jgi:hypothetical protein
MDLLKNISEKTINEVNYLDLAKKRIDFTKPCPSSEEAYRFASKLAKILGDEVNSSTVTRFGRYLDSRSGETVHGTFQWHYDANQKTIDIYFENSTGMHEPKYVYPKHEFKDFIGKIYTNERTGEVDVSYTTNKNEAYAIENNEKAIKRFREYMDRTGHNGKDMYFEDFTNKPKKVYKIAGV